MKNTFIGNKKRMLTVQYRLTPVGKTEEMQEKYKVFEDDCIMDQNFNLIKEVIKDLAFKHINDSLHSFTGSFDELVNLTITYLEGREKEIDTTDVRECIYKEKIRLCNELGAVLGTVKFTGKETVNLIREHVYNNYSKYEELVPILDLIESRSALLSDYESKIDNVLEGSLKAGTVAQRIINDNLFIFAKNLKLINSVSFKEIRPDISIPAIESISYDECFTQEGIDKYNEMTGSINIATEQYCQINRKRNTFKLQKLQKMILSDKESFMIEVFETDEDVKKAYDNLMKKLVNEKVIKRVMALSESNNLSHIYVKGNMLSDFSHSRYGFWGTARECIRKQLYDNTMAKTEKAKNEKVEKELAKLLKTTMSIADLDMIVEEYAEKANIKALKHMLCDFDISLSEITINGRLRDENNEARNTIRENLEELLSLRQILRTFEVSDDEDITKDDAFHSEVEELVRSLGDCVAIYNKIRNYVLKKPNRGIKYALSFKSSDFAGGWSDSIVNVKYVSLYTRGNEKYLAIYNRAALEEAGIKISAFTREIESKLTDEKTDNCYLKMSYAQVNSLNKAVPKNDIYPASCNTPEHIYNGVKTKLYNTDDDFLRKLIDYQKNIFLTKESYKRYKFTFKETSEYTSWKEFLDDAEQYTYDVKWKYIDGAYVDKLIENGLLLMYKISTRDSDGNKKNKLPYSQYLNYLFSKENEENMLVKLHGGAEVFYRPAQVVSPFVHRKGSVLVSKIDKYGNPVENYRQKAIDAQKGIISEELVTRIADYDIIKNKRYTIPVLEFHVPVTIGSKSDIVEGSLDERADEYIANGNGNVLVVGRSNNHLIYITVYDVDGNVIEKKSLNTVLGCNYKLKLEDITKEQETWTNKTSSQNLLDGYISYVVKELADLMLKYNARIVIPKIVTGAKTRHLLNNRVFAKLEAALVRKLENITDRTLAPWEAGSVFRPIQLADSDIDISKKNRNGFVFVVNESKGATDPDTRFTYNVYWNNYTNSTKRQNFLSKFIDFRFDKETNLFKLICNGAVLGTEVKKEYELYSYGKRIIYAKDEQLLVDATEYIKNTLANIGITSIDDNLLNQEDVSKINAVFNAVRILLQMRNVGVINGKSISFVVSPMMNDAGSFYETDTENGIEENNCKVMYKNHMDAFM